MSTGPFEDIRATIFGETGLSLTQAQINDVLSDPGVKSLYERDGLMDTETRSAISEYLAKKITGLRWPTGGTPKEETKAFWEALERKAKEKGYTFGGDEPAPQEADPPRLQGQDIPAPGQIQDLSEPTFVGNIPVRSEITVLPADSSEGKTLGFRVYESQGAPIGKELDVEGKPLPLTEIRAGDTVFVPGLMGIHTMKVVHSDDSPDEFFAQHPEGTGAFAILRFDYTWNCKIDPPCRVPCWCVVAWINPRGITKLQKRSSEV